MSGIELADPAEVVFLGTETKRHGFVVSVKEDGERLVANAVALIVCLVDLVAGQDHAEAGYMACLPVEIGHFCAVRLDPVEILDPSAMNRAALEKSTSTEDRVALAQPGQ